jgi:hypothetical protein
MVRKMIGHAARLVRISVDEPAAYQMRLGSAPQLSGMLLLRHEDPGPSPSNAALSPYQDIYRVKSAKGKTEEFHTARDRSLQGHRSLGLH